MRSNNVLGFIFAATLDDKIPELASSRTTASVPIGGKYRIIDFDSQICQTQVSAM